ncbi:Phosphomannomutase/phosphoglucomutase [Candidatus Kinetoplastibacterium sorsogonicusi]|uniref:Phosphomannomutase/phosphoglucomutase n=1 Tax=Candidatus Kinetoplastidibacterium kentomonadis TaxID=1576550 RepID=A0A3Q8EWQ5_9PROT|nr:phosphomannomutase/phosphoglucomutase [Candidatus Kinetoplastibacterium sorsogonicusi]AWD32235.1 Phosphomannomutase/phosphoglucomutase [Candidatus Kinetoplastibacterium sorsogonicusi]
MYKIKNIDNDPFKEYDIRGLFPNVINKLFAYKLGTSISIELASIGLNKIIIGKDNRLSSTILLKALERGLIDNGMNVLNIGYVTSPMLYFANYFYNIESSVIVTASHNPAEYNGFKIIINWENIFGDRLRNLKLNMNRIKLINNGNIGKISNLSIKKHYIYKVVNNIKLKPNIKLAIDCGNGVTSLIATKIFQLLGCQTFDIYSNMDGRFPNHDPDPSNRNNLKDLIKHVKKNNCEFGFAFDGDGDRIAIVNHDGDIITTDQQLSLFSYDILKKYPSSDILYDIKFNHQIEKTIVKLGGNPIIHKSGHSLIKNTINEKRIFLAGEMSGHIFFKDKWYGFDDGIYAGARFLEIFSNYNSYSQFFDKIHKKFVHEEIKLPMRLTQAYNIINNLKKNDNFGKYNRILYLDGIRVDYKNGFGLIRFSNTMPYLVLTFEASNTKYLKYIKNIFVKQIKIHLNKKLKKILLKK